MLRAQRSFPIRPSLFATAALCLPAAVTLAPAAHASEVRVNTLSRPAGIDDETSTFTYPSLVNRYSLAVAEFGTSADQEAYAAAFTQTSFGSIGVAFSRDQSAFNYLNAATGAQNDNDFITSHFARYSFARKFSSTFGVTPQRPLDLFYGLPLGTDQGFGLRLTLAGDTNEVTDTAKTVKKNATQFDLAGGYHMPVATGRVDIGLSLGLVGNLNDTTSPKSGPKTERTYERGLSARASARWVEIQATVAKPYMKTAIEWSQPRVASDAGGVSASKKAKDLAFDVQGGAIVSPTERVSLNGGLGAFFLQSEGPFTLSAPKGTAIDTAIRNGTEIVTANLAGPRATRTAYGVALNGGAEALVTDSVGVLAGVNYMVWGRISTKNKAAADEPKYSTNLPETADADLWSLGAYVKRDAFRFDAATAFKRFIHNGAYFVTGKATDNMVAQFAASYRF